MLGTDEVRTPEGVRTDIAREPVDWERAVRGGNGLAATTPVMQGI